MGEKKGKKFHFSNWSSLLMGVFFIEEEGTVNET